MSDAVVVWDVIGRISRIWADRGRRDHSVGSNHEDDCAQSPLNDADKEDGGVGTVHEGSFQPVGTALPHVPCT